MPKIVREPFPRRRLSVRRQLVSSSTFRVKAHESNETHKSPGQQFQRDATTRHLSILGWYRNLRAHHHWTIFQAVRYALWLTR